MGAPTRNSRQNECILLFDHALEPNEFNLLSDSLKSHLKDFEDIRISNSRKAVLIVATGVHLWCGPDPDTSDGIVVPIRVPLGPFPPPVFTQPLLHIRNYDLIILNLGVIDLFERY